MSLVGSVGRTNHLKCNGIRLLSDPIADFLNVTELYLRIRLWRNTFLLEIGTTTVHRCGYFSGVGALQKFLFHFYWTVLSVGWVLSRYHISTLVHFILNRMTDI